MAGYTPTIGLEIHAELRTKTKMFCSSKNDPEASPNTHICPVCLAHPGTLPVVNREAVRHVLRMGTALKGTLADYTEFDRKNYFYPDLPKGYQISQYQYPLVTGGELAGVHITRIHLEEDTATSRHDGTSSVVDFNRAGVPLMELVTEPVIHDAETASRFAKELQLLLRTLGAGEANMEKGEMRVEANISVSRDQKLGTKTEVKNLNSFKSVERAIEFEIKRQTEVLESGGTLVQETRGFDEERGITFSQRAKESSHDYRYFPDPDIPKLQISLIPEFSDSRLKASLPEMPWAKRARLLESGFDAEQADIAVGDIGEDYTEHLIAISNPEARKIAINAFFTSVRNTVPQEKVGQAVRELKDFGELRAENSVSSTMAIKYLHQSIQTGESFKALVMGNQQISDSESLSRIADKVISQNAKVVSEIKGGKLDAMKFLVGIGMKESMGRANPSELARILSEKLGL